MFTTMFLMTGRKRMMILRKTKYPRNFQPRSKKQAPKNPPAQAQKEQQPKKRPAATNPTTKKAQPQQKKKKAAVAPTLTAEEKNAKAKENAKPPFFLEGIDHTDMQKFVCFDEPWNLPDGEIKHASACVGFICERAMPVYTTNIWTPC
jgi:hypothetical protein